MRSRWTTPSESAESVNSAARHIVDRRASLRRELDGLFAGCEVSALKVFASTQAPNATHYELTDLAEGGKPHAARMGQFRDSGRVTGKPEVNCCKQIRDSASGPLTLSRLLELEAEPEGKG